MTDEKTNAFTSVRPRGTDIAPSAKPKNVNKGRAPPPLNGSGPVAMDRAGRKNVSLEPRDSKLHINNPNESLAMQDKQRKIAGKVGGAGR